MESLTSTDAVSNEIEIMRTYRAGGERGPLVAKTSYFTMADTILSLLLEKDEVSLVELVSYVEGKCIKMNADTNWLLLQVKQDLEYKGFVKSSLKDRAPHRRLLRNAFLKSEFKKILIQQLNEKSSVSHFFDEIIQKQIYAQK